MTEDKFNVRVDVLIDEPWWQLRCALASSDMLAGRVVGMLLFNTALRSCRGCQLPSFNMYTPPHYSASAKVSKAMLRSWCRNSHPPYHCMWWVEA